MKVWLIATVCIALVGCAKSSEENAQKKAPRTQVKKRPTLREALGKKIALTRGSGQKKARNALPEEDYSAVSVASVVASLTRPFGPPVTRAEKVFLAQPKKALPVLVGLLDNEDKNTRLHAVRILALLGSHAKEALVAVEKRLEVESEHIILSMVIETLRKVSPYSAALEKKIVGMLSHRSALVVWQALKTLGSYGDRASGALPEIRKKLTSKEGWVRLTAAQAIWQISKDDTSFTSLKGELSSNDQNLRKKMILILGEMKGSKVAVELLSKALSDKRLYLQRLAAISIKKHGASAAGAKDALKKAATSTDYSLRKYATEALANLSAQ